MSRLQIAAIVVFLFGFSAICFGLPVINSSESDESSSSEESAEQKSLEELRAKHNGTKDLYVIKAVVYEIGILTDSSDEDNSTDFESQERVDLTFFDTHQNSSHINLGTVPLPIQTNISGQVLTGIAPVDIGAFSDPAELLQTLPITGTIVNITHSNTGYFQLTSGSDLSQYESPHILNITDLTNIPEVSQSLPTLSGILDSEATKSSKDKSTDNLIK